MRLNHFVILGAQKSGTTALHGLLAEHPSLAMSTPKEVNFFINARTAYDEYIEFFPNAEGKKLLGEASPIYLLRCQEVAPVMAALIPKVKLIISLRNPITRAYSQFQMLLQIGKATGDFSTALTAALQIRSIDDVAFDPVTGYPVNPIQTLLLYGRYSQQLQCFWRHFDDRQILIIRHDDLLHAHAETMARIIAFLNLEPYAIKARMIHQRSYPPLPRKTWQRLHSLFQPELDCLECLLGWDLSQWKKPPSLI